MTLRQFIIVISTITLIFLGSLAWVVLSINPQQTNFIGLSLFYITFFLSLTGVITLIRLLIRRAVNKELPAFYCVVLSFRQAILLSSMFVILHILWVNDFLNSWLFFLILAITFIIEITILSKNPEQIAKKRKQRISNFHETELVSVIKKDPTFQKRRVQTKSKIEE